MFNKIFGKKTAKDRNLSNHSYDLNKIYPIIKGQTTSGTTEGLENTKEPLSIDYIDNLSIYFAEDKGDRFENL